MYAAGRLDVDLDSHDDACNTLYMQSRSQHQTCIKRHLSHGVRCTSQCWHNQSSAEAQYRLLHMHTFLHLTFVAVMKSPRTPNAAFMQTANGVPMHTVATPSHTRKLYRPLVCSPELIDTVKPARLQRSTLGRYPSSDPPSAALCQSVTVVHVVFQPYILSDDFTNDWFMLVHAAHFTRGGPA
jgi:hypothetical protein